MNELYLRLIMASDDPCDLAINYGKTWTAVGNLLPVLERWFVIKKRDVEVECDFEGSSTTISARLDLTITLGRLFSMGFRYGIRGLKEFINFKNKIWIIFYFDNMINERLDIIYRSIFNHYFFIHVMIQKRMD